MKDINGFLTFKKVEIIEKMGWMYMQLNLDDLFKVRAYTIQYGRSF